MESLQNLIQEFKLRTLWWILCIFTLTYFLTHTSKSMLLNIPIAILFVSMLRILLNEVEFGWKVRNPETKSYLSHLGKQRFDNDFRIGNAAGGITWKRKIDSPVVEAAVEDFIDQILLDFVVELWYSNITPDREAPRLIRDLIMDVLGEVCGRIKELNVVELLTKDVVDLIGNHIELFRRNQSDIGLDVMKTLSCEERDETLKHHLLSSNELHPALISSDCEYKVLQRLMGGVLAVVLRPREAQSPLVRCIARELLTCLVIQPVMNFATPEYINELIEYIVIAYQNEGSKDFATDQSPNMDNHSRGNTVSGKHVRSSESNLKNTSSNNQRTDLSLLQSEHTKDEPIHTRHVGWAKVIDAASQRRSEVLMPENLENMWTGGRNYQKKLDKRAKHNKAPTRVPLPQQDTCPTSNNIDSLKSLEDNKEMKGELEATVVPHESRNTLKKSDSTSDLKVWINLEGGKGTTAIINEYYSADIDKLNANKPKSSSDVVIRSEGLHTPRLRCRVLGAYFERLGSQSFAVYSIAVTDADNNTCFVKRRYRNFERLHRHLKDIPNYTLHLPPKRIFSSSTDDAFVHQRCILLDKYLQELLSIANVAEQHEVWDFLSDSSKNYSFGKSTSVMRSLAVNVDDAMDDIVRQFKGVSDNLVQAPSTTSKHLWDASGRNKLVMSQTSCESLSDTEDSDIHHVQKQVMPGVGWRSDGELDSEGHRTKPKDGENSKKRGNEEIHSSRDKSEPSSRYPKSTVALTGVPPEWTPPNMSVPVLNLVENIFQLKRRGWLRRQVFWISKQILQLVMEDAIDDWLLRQIQWLRRENIIAQGIRWVKDVLWPDGTFFRRLRIQDAIDNFQSNLHSHQKATQPGGKGVIQPGSFEQHLEAARRASDVKKIIFNGAPTTLVSLIGHKHYRRCARDIYYFLQSTVCLKQLGYAILELVLLSIFPELRDLVMDIHEKTQPE